MINSEYCFHIKKEKKTLKNFLLPIMHELPLKNEIIVDLMERFVKELQQLCKLILGISVFK